MRSHPPARLLRSGHFPSSAVLPLAVVTLLGLVAVLLFLDPGDAVAQSPPGPPPATPPHSGEQYGNLGPLLTQIAEGQLPLNYAAALGDGPDAEPDPENFIALTIYTDTAERLVEMVAFIAVSYTHLTLPTKRIV